MAVNKIQHDEGGEFDSTMEDPLYLLLARQAEMYLEGDHGLEKDPSYAGQSCGLCGQCRGAAQCNEQFLFLFLLKLAS